MTRFSDGLKKDIEHRLRAAIAKLNNWSIDAYAEEIRLFMERPEGDYRESSELESRASGLRHELAWFVARGTLNLSPKSEEALRWAEASRRPRHGTCSGAVPPPAPEARPRARRARATCTRCAWPKEACICVSRSPALPPARKRELGPTLFSSAQLNGVKRALLLLPPPAVIDAEIDE